MPLTPGTKLGHFEILSAIGEGGMGEVYRAHDDKLDRDVAIKVIRADAIESSDRRVRFIREAKAAAVLNHPNIATVYEIGNADELTFIAMELIEGEKLSALIASGALTTERATAIAIDVAEGLRAAHAKGIVHRDLKPDNIMILDDGRTKIIDFGLAKLLETGSEGETATKAQAMVGTVAYMSPEQARSGDVDHRSDLFSFGVVLHEMLTGGKPFEGPSAPETLNAIINAPLPRLPSALSAYQPIVDRCLAKDAGSRYSSAQDVAAALRAPQPIETSAPHNRDWRPWVLAGAAAAIVSAIVLSRDNRDADHSLGIANATLVTRAVGVENYPVWSPDGETLAYEASTSPNLFGANSDVWVLQVRGKQTLNRTAERGADDRFPSWSPDGTQIAFWSARAGGSPYDGSIYVAPGLAGAARRLSAANALVGPPQWSPDGEEIAYPIAGENVIEILTVSSGETRRIELQQLQGAYDLAWSPDGRYFAFIRTAGGLVGQITQLVLLRVSDGEELELTDGMTNVWSPSWRDDGRTLAYVSNRGGPRDLWIQRLNEDGTPAGDPDPVTSGMEILSASFSADGNKVAYSKGRRVANVWRVPILEERVATWNDAEQITQDQAFIEFVAVSPDGSQLAVSSDRAGNPDLWILPASGGEMRSLTTDGAPDWDLDFSPDGSEIVFYAYRSGNRDLWVIPTEGGAARQLTSHAERDSYPSWSPDGTQIAFDSWRSGTSDIWLMTLATGEMQRLTSDPGNERVPRWSPDGKWITFSSANGMWRISPDGGDPELIHAITASTRGFSPNGEQAFALNFTGDVIGSILAIDLETKVERTVADLGGRDGSLVGTALATDGDYIYFAWGEDNGDIWVADVVEGR